MEIIMVNKNNIQLLRDKAIGAMLGSACGDALGWPNERMSRSKHRKQKQDLFHEFKRWTRQSGGRFYSHDEIIEAGEYSDDTQLILCLCRSLLHGSEWWHYWTEVELPFWTLYERGGGGATKRAAEMWKDGKAPWTPSRKDKDIKKYFDAGGNGVAMRVLPHTLYFINTISFSSIAKNIMLDGITTHGHPRALVGALAYGYALWKALQRNSRLEYGEIISDLLKNITDWANIPDISSENKKWLEEENHFQSKYEKLWETTVQEIKSLLLICRKELDKGAIVIDDEVLQTLGCFDPKINGSGIITATAAVFLVSRYAPDPIHGLIKAAFALGSDTDTIASMSGGLLGAINGSAWLSSLKDNIQDSTYLIKMAESLIDQNQKELQPKRIYGIHLNELKNWSEKLVKTESNELIMPDGRKGTVGFISDQISKSGRYKVQFRKVVCEDGQNLFFKKISQCEFKPNKLGQSSRTNETPAQPRNTNINFGPKLSVESFDKSVKFYHDLLGLNVKKTLDDTIVFEQGLVLVPKNYRTKHLEGIELRAMLYIEVRDIEKQLALVRESGLKIITPINQWGKSLRLFRCYDPDGNIVEVFANVP